MMKSVIGYEDYRLFMNDYYQWKKSTSVFSWRRFNKKGGFSSPNHMKLVCEGKSGLSETGVEQAADALDLIGMERVYFRQLVKFCQAKDETEKKIAHSEMMAIACACRVRVLGGESVSFYDSWKYPVLWELASIIPKATPLDMCKACGNVFSQEEICNALAFLTRANFLKKTAPNKYEQVDRFLQMSTATVPSQVRSMHKDMASLAEKSIEKYAVEERNFSGVTMGINEDDYALILKELDACRKRIISIASATKKGNRVYRLNLQLFPLTEKV